MLDGFDRPPTDPDRHSEQPVESEGDDANDADDQELGDVFASINQPLGHDSADQPFLVFPDSTVPTKAG